MNNYIKAFFHRGLIFAGFGPVITGIIIWAVSLGTNVEPLNASQMLIAIVSTYLLAFVHAGASVFNQIEHWPIMKSLLCHLGTLYTAYTACYLFNSWLPFDWKVLLIFTAIFLAVYLAIWVIVLISLKATSRKFNSKIK